MFGLGQLGMPGGGFGPNFGNFGLRRGSFKSQYRCFSVSICARDDLERGGKIIMPPSALDQLTQLNIQYPMLFKLTGPRESPKTTHCGVLEFVADEGKVFIPYWMMKILEIEEGDFLTVESVSLPLASFVKFDPLEEEFHDITNPKAVLETNLRSFACLTNGDVIEISYNSRLYRLKVLDTQPGNAVSIIECDMNVDFTPPRSLLEKPPAEKKAAVAAGGNSGQAGQISPEERAAREALAAAQKLSFQAFGGQGFRLDGKGKKKGKTSKTCTTGGPTASQDEDGLPPLTRGVPNLDYKKGKITFSRNFQKKMVDKEETESPDFVAFAGAGHSMRRKR